MMYYLFPGFFLCDIEPCDFPAVKHDVCRIGWTLCSGLPECRLWPECSASAIPMFVHSHITSHQRTLAFVLYVTAYQLAAISPKKRMSRAVPALLQEVSAINGVTFTTPYITFTTPRKFRYLLSELHTEAWLEPKCVHNFIYPLLEYISHERLTRCSSRTAQKIGAIA